MSKSRYRKIEQLGVGSYGRVYKAELLDNNGKPTGEIVAIKRNISSDTVEGIQNGRELAAFNNIWNRNRELEEEFPYALTVSKLHFGFQPINDASPVGRSVDIEDDSRDDEIHFEMSLADCNLQRMLDESSYTLTEWKSMMYQMALSIKFVNAERIVHRDIKPTNFLVYYNKEHQLPGPMIKLADYGLCFYDIGDDEPKSPRGIMTAFYRPPEVTFEQEFYDRKIDIWSLGCCFYEMASTRNIDFMSVDKTLVGMSLAKQKIRNADLIKAMSTGYPFAVKESDIEYLKDCEIANVKLQKVRNTSIAGYKKPRKVVKFMDIFNQPDFLELLKNMLRLNPEERYSIDDVLNDPYFAEIKQIHSFDRFFVNINEEIYTLQGKKRTLVKHIFEKLDYTKKGTSTKIFFNVFEFCSRAIVCYNWKKEIKFDEEFILAVYFIFYKFENVLSVNYPTLSLEDRGIQNYKLDNGKDFNDDRILNLEKEIMLNTSGDLARRNLYVMRSKPRVQKLWDFIWSYEKESEYLDQYLADFDKYLEIQKTKREENKRESKSSSSAVATREHNEPVTGPSETKGKSKASKDKGKASVASPEDKGKASVASPEGKGKASVASPEGKDKDKGKGKSKAKGSKDKGKASPEDKGKASPEDKGKASVAIPEGKAVKARTVPSTY